MLDVSTHSRLKAAGFVGLYHPERRIVSTHSRLKAAGSIIVACRVWATVSTHSRLKAAGTSCRPSQQPM